MTKVDTRENTNQIILFSLLDLTLSFSRTALITIDFTDISLPRKSVTEALFCVP
jgi:hypothetical protein